jgi:hypothetical protein
MWVFGQKIRTIIVLLRGISRICAIFHLILISIPKISYICLFPCPRKGDWDWEPLDCGNGSQTKNYRRGKPSFPGDRLGTPSFLGSPRLWPLVFRGGKSLQKKAFPGKTWERGNASACCLVPSLRLGMPIGRLCLPIERLCRFKGISRCNHETRLYTILRKG